MLYSWNIQTHQLHANDHGSMMQQMLKKDNDCTSRSRLLAVRTRLLRTWDGRSVQGNARKVSERNNTVEAKLTAPRHITLLGACVCSPQMQSISARGFGGAASFISMSLPLLALSAALKISMHLSSVFSSTTPRRMNTSINLMNSFFRLFFSMNHFL